MKRQNQNTSLNINKQAILALSLAMFAGNAAFAQGLEAGSMGSLSQSQALGPEQDSLLPPEVVPLDPAVATRMQMTQSTNMVPQAAQAFDPNQFNGMQSSRDFRQAALNGLMNHDGQWNGQQPGASAANGLSRQTAQGNTLNALGPMANQVAPPGQSGWVMAGADPNAVSNHHQSQTLTGASKHPQVQRSTKRGGFSNGFSSKMALGSGFLLGGFGHPNTLAGMGMFGLGATGFGTRNGFRF